MGKVLLVCRLAARDLRRRRGEAVMLLVVMMAATTALTLGLVLHGVTAQPYQSTRAATAGPDVLATAFPAHSGPPAGLAGLADVAPLTRAPGVIGRTGPYPVAFPVLRADGHTDAVLAEGRDPALASVDQPKLTEGSWVRSGSVVVERSFADALGIHAGDLITLNGRSFRVAGVAVTAALPTNGIGFLEGSSRWPNPGLIWLTQADARSLATAAQPLGYVLNLKLADPAGAEAFADRFTASGSYTNNTGSPFLIPWQDISQQDGLLVRAEQKILLVGSWLLALLAVGSLAILVGGRMAEQIRRVGLLKAVGGTPALVAAVLLTEHLAVALVAAVAGLVVGRLTAPLLTSPGAALLGTAGTPQLTLSTIGVVVAVALAVAVAATFVPAIRAARTSTVRALADAARPPRRRAWLIGRSARLPVPLLLAVRLAARRPLRIVLSVLSIAVTVSGIVAVLFAHATLAVSQFGLSAGSANPDLFDVGFTSLTEREDQVLLVVTVMLAALAAVNAIFITRATVQDSRHTSAVTRALGATPQQLTAGLSAAQVLPALAGALLGIPAGFGLFALANQGGSASQPPAWWLIAAVLGTVIAVAGLTSVPARTAARRPVAEILQSETA
ncbi:MAG: FtsX-like permease family protein [Streptosporangiaceae bacterium]